MRCKDANAARDLTQAKYTQDYGVIPGPINFASVRGAATSARPSPMLNHPKACTNRPL
jgi:hypothetical protein